jgi:hypothetical protein
VTTEDDEEEAGEVGSSSDDVVCICVVLIGLGVFGERVGRAVRFGTGGGGPLGNVERGALFLAAFGKRNVESGESNFLDDEDEDVDEFALFFSLSPTSSPPPPPPPPPLRYPEDCSGLWSVLLLLVLLL